MTQWTDILSIAGLVLSIVAVAFSLYSVKQIRLAERELVALLRGRPEFVAFVRDLPVLPHASTVSREQSYAAALDRISREQSRRLSDTLENAAAELPEPEAEVMRRRLTQVSAEGRREYSAKLLSMLAS